MSDALVISGGGRNGAFAAGALYRLATDGGLKFDAVSGTSTGALIAGPALLDDVEVINDIYRGGVRGGDVLERRLLTESILVGNFAKTGPLRELVNRYTDHDGLARAATEGRWAAVTCVNWRTGKKVVARSDSVFGNRWVDHVVASASMPILMEPTVIDGDEHVDGGIRDVVPVVPVTTRVDVDRVWVLKNFPPGLDVLPENPKGLLGGVRRLIDILVDEVALNDTPPECLLAANGVDIHVIEPKGDLGDSLDFDPEVMRMLWQMGFDAAGPVLEAALGGPEV